LPAGDEMAVTVFMPGLFAIVMPDVEVKTRPKTRLDAAYFPAGTSSAIAGGRIPGIQERVQIFAETVGGLAFTVNCPLQQRAAHHRLHGAGQGVGVSPGQLAGVDRVVEQRLDPGAHAARVGQRVAMEIGIEEIHLQEGKAVRQRLRRVGAGRRGR
jgi:hypothetical protein